MAIHPSNTSRHGRLRSMRSARPLPKATSSTNNQAMEEPNASSRDNNRGNWLSEVFMHGLGDMRLCTPSVAPRVSHST